MDLALQRTVDKIARRYAAVCWWAEFDDLRQEGWVAALTAQRTWDASRGVPLTNYAGRAVARHLLNYTWACRAPVHGRVGHAQSLVGVLGVELDDTMLSYEVQPEAELWWRDVQRIMREIVLEKKGGDVAASVLFDGVGYTAAARRARMRKEKVVKLTRAAKYRLRTDKRLHLLVMS